MSAIFEQAPVKMFNAARGFGFLTTKDGDLFFHISRERPVMELEGHTVFINRACGTPSAPKVGDQILFERARGDRGPYAKNWGLAPRPIQTVAQMREVILAAKPGDKLNLTFTNRTFNGDLQGRVYMILAIAQNGGISFAGTSAMEMMYVAHNGWGDFRNYTIKILDKFDADYFISKTIGKEMLVSIKPAI